MKLLVTGAAGFIGSNYVRTVLRERPDAHITVLDALTYAGRVETIQDLIESGQIRFVEGRIQDADAVGRVLKEHQITHLVNFAAETHNDRSLLSSGAFLQSNVVGVYTLLNAVREFGLEKMVHVSTDEVYGSIVEGEFTEASPLEPNTPYSASKAGGDLQCRSHFISYGTPVVVTRGGNTYGPYQYPEKLISFFTTRLIDGKRVPLYGDGSQVREWIHAEDHARGVDWALLHGQPGEAYNVGDVNERPNHEIVRILLEETGRGPEMIKNIEDPRKGAHDQRYSMSTAKLRALGWKPVKPFEASLREVVRWYRDNEAWWRPIQADLQYQDFIKAFYGKSLGEEL